MGFLEDALTKIITEISADAKRLSQSKRRGDQSVGCTLSYCIRIAEDALKASQGLPVETPRDIILNKVKAYRLKIERSES